MWFTGMDRDGRKRTHADDIVGCCAFGIDVDFELYSFDGVSFEDDTVEG